MHWPDDGPDHSRGGMVSVKQLGGKYRVPVSVTTQRELASHKRSVGGQYELVGVRMDDLPADYVVGGGEGAEPEPQHMPVGP
jgi:hypothetical protein